MWLSQRFGSIGHPFAETGTVAIGGNSTLKTASSVQGEGVQNFAPYGYSAFAPSGEDILLINSSDGTASAGTRMKDRRLAEGEISITSKGGGKIALKNDGTVEINGFSVTASGKLVNPDGEVIV